jgi:ribosome maturation factor RimP
MAGQHIENLFRRFKGEVVDVKTVSGGIYSGRVVEVTNDYVCLTETAGAPGQQVFVTFSAIESMAATTADS